MKVFSGPTLQRRYVRVGLINVKYVEGFGDGEIVHTREEAAAFFKAQDKQPIFIHLLLVPGVSAKLFQKHLSLPTDQAQTSVR